MGGVLSCDDVKAAIAEEMQEAEAKQLLRKIADDIFKKGVGTAIRENAPEVAKLADVVLTELSEAMMQHIEKHIEAKGAVGTVDELAEVVGEAVSSAKKSLGLREYVVTDTEQTTVGGEEVELPTKECAEAEPGVGDDRSALAAKEVAGVARDAAAESTMPAELDVAEIARDGVAECAMPIEHIAAVAEEGIEVAKDTAAVAMPFVLAVEFVGEKGMLQKVVFRTRELGFEPALAGGGCLRSKGQPKTVVKLGKGGQAHSLGVRSKWTVTTIDGKKVTGLEQARRLLAESVAKLPEV